MADVEVHELRKRFGAVQVIDGVSFTARAGTIVTLLGPSGCGKTTILRSIAGLEHPDSGRISIGGDVVFDPSVDVHVPAERREIGMVFQSYAIWPHLSVYDNVAFPLRLRKLPRDRVQSEVMDTLGSVGLAKLHDRFPSQLSGGQQQRVVLARCLVYRPRVLLLDEPLANLDAKLREEMRFELREVQQRFGLTCVYVTHDQAEAMALSDQILVMEGGRILREGSARDVFAHPGHEFVASFLGNANLLRGHVGERNAGMTELHLQKVGVIRVPGTWEKGAPVTVALRPVDMRLRRPRDDASSAMLQGRLIRVTFLGDALDCVALVGETELRVRCPVEDEWQAGDAVQIELPQGRTHVLPGAVGV